MTTTDAFRWQSPAPLAETTCLLAIGGVLAAVSWLSRSSRSRSRCERTRHERDIGFG